jgi:hypothetical protein
LALEDNELGATKAPLSSFLLETPVEVSKWRLLESSN